MVGNKSDLSVMERYLSYVELLDIHKVDILKKKCN